MTKVFWKHKIAYSSFHGNASIQSDTKQVVLEDLEV